MEWALCRYQAAGLCSHHPKMGFMGYNPERKRLVKTIPKNRSNYAIKHIFFTVPSFEIRSVHNSVCVRQPGTCPEQR
jgi:hypothetical protein